MKSCISVVQSPGFITTKSGDSPPPPLLTPYFGLIVAAVAVPVDACTR